MNQQPRQLGRPSISRRDFLRAAASTVGAASVLAGEHFDPTRTVSVPLRLRPGEPPARVVQIRSERVVDGPTVHRGRLQLMLEDTLSTLTRTDSSAAAWRKLLEPQDVVGIKFNRTGQAALGTTAAFADALVESLVSAGWDPKRIVLLEAPATTISKWQTMAAVEGFDDVETAFASGADQFAKVLHQVTTLISVPFLKTHNIAGMTGAMKNLSHALVKHPGRYHAGGCSPFIPDILAVPAIRGKLKLCLVDGLRAVIRGGPEAQPFGIRDAGFVLASTDPVAVDAHAVTILNQLRGELGLGRLAGSPEAIPHLRAAHERGLGIAIPHGIDVVSVSAAE